MSGTQEQDVFKLEKKRERCQHIFLWKKKVHFPFTKFCKEYTETWF